jgi:hypothetical protein
VAATGGQVNDENRVLSNNWIEVPNSSIGRYGALRNLSVSDARFAFLIPYAVPSLPHSLRFLLVAFADWINRQQREVIAYLQEENRVLREQLGPRPLRCILAQPSTSRSSHCAINSTS